MPETDGRIILWRNTIQLFHVYKKANFTGPFFASGYTNYRVESPLSEKRTGNPKTPDIFACGPDGWLIIEITVNDKSKQGQLDSYRELDARSLSVYGCQMYAIAPDTMSSRSVFNNDGDHCEMVVVDSFDLKKEHFIQNDSLRDALIRMKGHDMSELPEIPFSLVPEMKHFEIRRGIVDIVLQIFNPLSEGISLYQICEDGLERLFPLVTATSRQSLMHKIETEMEILITKDLVGYLEFKGGKYHATEKFRQYPMSRQAVGSKLQDWANPEQRTIADFGAET